MAALLRFVRLGEPPSVVFDETYYARDACLYLDLGQSFCGAPQTTEQSYVHPPLGKWLIAAGIKAFGYTPFGWRFTAALFGTALVLLVFLLARRLFNDRWTAGAAGLLVATDFLLIAQSRIAMLDVFLAFFVVLGLLFLVIDRDRVLLLREHAGHRIAGDPPRREYEWRIAAGAAFGLALAVKWSAAPALAGAGLLAIGWSAGLAWAERRHRPPDAPRRGWWGRLVREIAVSAAAFGLVPLLVHVLGYAVWFMQNQWDLQAFIDLQRRVAEYHLTLKATHTYQSKAWTWPLVLRPIAYHWSGTPEATHVLAFGNPATWWASLGAALWLLWRSLRRWAPERVVVVGLAAQYLPWLIVARPLFFFYMTPIAPFMMVGLAAGLSAFRRAGPASRFVVWAYLVVGVGLLLWWFYPVIAAVAIPMELWQSRMWFSSWI